MGGQLKTAQLHSGPTGTKNPEFQTPRALAGLWQITEALPTLGGQLMRLLAT